MGWAYQRGVGRSSSGYNRECEVFSACAAGAIYRRDVFEKIGYFDEMHFCYLEDIDIGYRAQIFGYRNGYCPKAVVYHAGSGSSGSRYNAFKVNLSSRNSIYLIAKNMPLLQILLNLPLLAAGYLVKTVFFTKKGFGYIYVRGIWRGIRLACSVEGRKNKISFKVSRMRNYIRIQLQLWANVMRRLAD